MMKNYYYITSFTFPNPSFLFLNFSGTNYFPFLFILLFCSCGKESIDLLWTEQKSNTAARLTAVHFTDAETGHIVGGEAWTLGLYLSTINGGDTWMLDTVDQSLLYNLSFTEEGKGHAVGISGVFQKPTLLSTWWRQGLNTTQQIPPINDVEFWDDYNGLIVGGAGYSNGLIMRFGENYEILKIDTFSQELYTVAYSNEEVVHAMGYGLVLRSIDAGLNWEVQSIDSDAYRDIHFPSEQVGYAVGYGGTILKTLNSGETWEKIRDGNKFLVSDKAFRSVFFVDEEKGYIVGDKGLFWRTNDGGDNWMEVADFPDVNLFDVFGIGDGGYVVGEEGRIFRFVD